MFEHAESTHIARVLSKPTGPLGFGCGLLSTVGSRSSAIRLLEAAFECGITYYDTARLYAEGQAEGMLGEAFSRQRDQVIVVSKAGILPTSRTLTKRVADKAVHLARKMPAFGAVLREPKPAEPTFGVFDIPRLRQSVETSLRELRTDYLDALLLHECTPEDARSPEIRTFVEDLVKEGKIRTYGVAPRAKDAVAIEREGIGFGPIVQLASDPWENNVERLPPRDGRLVITHSVFAKHFRSAIEHLRADTSAAARWRAAIDVDPTDEAAMARLFLGHALYSNPSGIVLFSTTNPERIRQNLDALSSPLPPDQLARLPAVLKSL